MNKPEAKPITVMSKPDGGWVAAYGDIRAAIFGSLLPIETPKPDQEKKAAESVR